MDVIKLMVSREKNLERLKKVIDDPAFIACLLKLKGFNKFPSGVEIKIILIKEKDNEKEIGNTCGNCIKPV